MQKSKVLSLVPFLAIIDVTVEVPLVSATLTLCFGPFNSREDGEGWAAEVELLHRHVEKQETQCAGEVLSEMGFPTGAFVRSYISVPDVILGGVEARKPGALIPISTPEVIARDMHLYALQALQEAAQGTLSQLNQ